MKNINSSHISQLLPITKSDYLLFLSCKHEFWLTKHHPEVYASVPDPGALHIMQQGNEIERIARNYFCSTDNQKVSFQRVYESEHVYARADIVITNVANNETDLIEVKSGTSVKDEYIDDLAFQYIAAQETGISFARVGVLYVNKDYVYSPPLQAHRFLKYEDVTKQVLDRLDITREHIRTALIWLQQTEPVMAIHEYCNKKLDCPALQRYHPNLPDYTVFNISHIKANKLQPLLTSGIVDIRSVPDDFKLSDKQKLQVQVAKRGEPRINRQAITESLEALQYPLYFLDYESLAYGIPLYAGIRPYQQMVFQWSMHTLYDDCREPSHDEFLSDGSGHPSYEFAKALQQAIPDDGGTVVVWNKGFETGRNKELAAMYPEFSEFMHGINNRVFDLMEVFQQQHYSHPADKGSYSIKQILPILAPHLTYANLDISYGQLASIRWFEMATNKANPEDMPKILDDLRKYCCLDTLAMVEIYKALRNVVYT